MNSTHAFRSLPEWPFFLHSVAPRSYKPDMAVWNFLPLFPDEETLVFQDQPLFPSCALAGLPVLQ